MSVPAGRFDIYRVRCKSGSRPEPVHQRIWYYAPDLGHYVLYIYKRDRKTRRRHELIAVLPPFADHSTEMRDAVRRIFQESLENSPSGTPVVSEIDGDSASVAVFPTMTFRNEKGEFCRNYVQVFAFAKGSSRFPGLACREEDGVWRIPAG
ncbi:MAG: hypothetical protein MI741_06035 [Rhodospirillales bacterium]|nr:hypothetical protein [Rhodospirillales bacterium]